MRSSRMRSLIGSGSNLRGWGQDPATGAASCAVPGAVPGVCYPANFPPTTAAAVNQEAARLPYDIRKAVEKIGSLSADKLLGVLNAWATAAWNAIQAGEAAYAQMAAIPMPGLCLGPCPGIAEVPATALGVPGLKEYFQTWRGELDTIRRGWDRVHPAKEGLRAYLRGQGTARGTAAGVLEVRRLAGFYAGLVQTAAVSVNAQHGQIRALLAQRQQQASFGQVLVDIGASTRAAAEAIGSAGRAAIGFTVGVVGSLVGALVPWWVWPIAAGVGYLWIRGQARRLGF